MGKLQKKKNVRMKPDVAPWDRGWRRQEDREFKAVFGYIVFKASLGYLRPFLKRKKRETRVPFQEISIKLVQCAARIALGPGPMSGQTPGAPDHSPHFPLLFSHGFLFGSLLCLHACR